MSLNWRIWLAVLTCSALASACGGAATAVGSSDGAPGAGKEGGPAASSPTSQAAAGSMEEPTAAAPAADALDLDAIDVCELMPGEEVAAALNATQDQEPSTSSGGGVAGCWYSLIPADSNVLMGKIYILYLEPAEFFEYYVTSMDNPEPVSGLGDQAMIEYRSDSEDYVLDVSVPGKATIEVIGEDPDLVTQLAQYAVDHLD